MQQRKDRLGQEVEPAPVDRIDEPSYPALVLIAADGFPFLGARIKPGADLGTGAGGNGHDIMAHFSLIDVVLRHVFGDGRPRLALFRDQRRHPVMVGKADPAIGGGGLLFGRQRLALGHGEISEIGVIHFAEGAIGAAHQPFVHDVGVLQLGQAMARNNAIGRKTRFGGACVVHLVGDGEHEIRINADRAGKGQALGVLPSQRYRGLVGQRGIARDGPLGLGIRHIRRFQPVARQPAKDGVIGVVLAHWRHEPHFWRGRIDSLAIALQQKVVDPPARKRQAARQFGRVDGHARRLGGRLVAGGGRSVLSRRGSRGLWRGGGCRGLLRHGLLGEPLRKQHRTADKPGEDHHEAECGCEEKILVLIVHPDHHHSCSGSAVVQRQGRQKVKRFPLPRPGKARLFAANAPQAPLGLARAVADAGGG